MQDVLSLFSITTDHPRFARKDVYPLDIVANVAAPIPAWRQWRAGYSCRTYRCLLQEGRSILDLNYTSYVIHSSIHMHQMDLLLTIQDGNAGNKLLPFK